MELIHTGTRFECVASFDERMLPKGARFRWDPKAKKWWTDREETAAKLIDYATDDVKSMLQAAADAREAALAGSRATDYDGELPCPEGEAYLPYQRAGIAYALSHNDVLIGDEMGLGKTIQALGVLNTDESIKTCLIICPASLRLNWAREAEKWLVRPRKIAVISSGKDKWPSAADVVIINYDILKKYREWLHGIDWDCLIVDEAHYLKNPKAQRTQEVYGAWNKDPKKVIKPISARRRVLLTGTPLPNRPIELWPMLKATGLFKSWQYYVKRHCNGHRTRYGWDVTGASNLEDLQEYMREKLMVRRLKKDVLTELPPKRRQVIELPANGALGAVQAEQAYMAERDEILNDLRVAVELAKTSEDPQVYEDAVKALQEGEQAAFTEMSRLRRQTAVAKVPYVVEHLQNAIESSGKVVVMAHHKKVVRAIAADFGDACVTLTGDTKMDDRQAAVDRFQEDPTCTLFIGNIQAAGVGITLTAASHVVFAELDWVPGNLSQAEDRCHRIGQNDSVLVQHLVLEGSLDAVMARKIVSKQDVIDRAMDREVDRNALNEQIVIKTKAASAKRDRDDIGKLAATITLEQSTAILEALQLLSSMCDGAMSEDGSGFNKIDTRIGKSLALNAELSPRQAALGKIIVKKYHGQIGPELMTAIYPDWEEK